MINLKLFLRSLSFKLSLAIITIILFTSFTVGIVIFQGQKTFLEKELHKKGLYLSKLLSEQLIEPLLYEEKFTLYKTLEASFNAEPDYILFAEVFSLQGDPMVALFKEKPPQNLQPDILKNINTVSFKEFADHYEILSPIIAKNYGIIGYLRLGISYKTWKETLQEVHSKAFFTVFFITLLGILIALFITRKIIQPAQERMLRAEKLSALGQFASGLAHEIKNPLTSVKLLLQESIESQSPLEKRDLEIIEKELNRIDKIVKDFLSFARVNKRELKLVNLSELIGNVVELCRGEIEKAGIDLEIHSPLPVIEIYGDEDGLKQVIINLLLNSFQAINGKGGKIEIKLQKIGKQAKINIVDTGLGIPKRFLPHIFDPFFTTKKEGTGLGLSIVSRIVKEHRGKIEVFSEEGKGTNVEIILPLSGKSL